MVKWFGSFLIRRWRLSSGAERIEIEHIQTGEHGLLNSLPAALEWIADREGAPPAARPPQASVVPPAAGHTLSSEPDE